MQLDIPHKFKFIAGKSSGLGGTPIYENAKLVNTPPITIGFMGFNGV